MSSKLYDKIYEIVEQIPKGKVTNYGTIAMLCGNPKASRAVGFALHQNPKPGIIPCHRVVFKDGSLCTGFAFGGFDAQKKLLLDEGVHFLPDGRVDLKSSGWLISD